MAKDNKGDLKKQLAKHLDDQFKPKKKSNAAALEARRFEDDFDQIFKAYTDKTYKLSETLQRQMDRWNFARECFTANPHLRNDRLLANMLITQFEISHTQAYVDVRNMKRFFASADQTNAEFDKIIHRERVLRHIEMAENMGEKGIRVLAALDKEFSNIIGVGREKDETPPPVNITINVVYNPELVGGKTIPDLESKVLEAVSRAKTKDEKKYIDVDFEELSDDK